MKKISNVGAKTIGIVGVNSMALISGMPITLLVTIPVSVAILCKKETAHDKLVTEISKSFKLNVRDAEKYASYLEDKCKSIL